jgi:TrmH family RNA methyltransferase
VKITSTANPRIKAIVRLRDRRDRKETGLFIVEGFREIRRAIASGITIDELWTCPPLFLGTNEPELVTYAETAGAEIVEATEEPFRRSAYRDRPEGLLAICRQFDTSIERLHVGERPLVLVVEAIEKPGNLGTMIRTATAAAADAVIVADPTTDIFNPNVVRASLGTLFSIPITVCTTDEGIAWLRERDIRICAATPDGDTDLWDAKLEAVVVGAEQYGLSEPWLDAADTKVRIPMPGTSEIDSLNAATSASILLFEAVRQRA